jgi:multicomponent Na+:H+ antiporter subunit D
MLLGFSGLAFYLMSRVIAPHTALNLDFDWFYRLVGRGALILVCAPIALVDNVWTAVWDRVGVRLLRLLGRFTSWFDGAAIDGVVDGAAGGVRGIGLLASLLQNGKLQQYLGLMVTAALLIFAFLWYGLRFRF